MEFLHPRWPVLYLDNHLLALYKPAGLLVQGDRTGDPSLQELAKAWLKERFAKPGRVFLGIVHRLDRPVAGVVLLARTSKAAARLSAQFREGRILKRYWAVVEGEIATPAGTLEDHILRRQQYARIVDAGTPRARAARLTYRVQGVRRGRSLVEIDLATGRHHQIRLQMAHMGHPLVGDRRYGAAASLPAGRIALLARLLGVTHPTRREALTLEAPWPSGWPWDKDVGQADDVVPWDLAEMALPAMRSRDSG
jgi:23S rRNA pseudouridine1911/1915/1917 synthase